MKKFLKVSGIVLAVLVVLFAIFSVFMGKYVADRILYQNAENDTVSNSVKQLEVWGYDLDSFYSTYGYGVTGSAVASDGNEVPFTVYENGPSYVVLVHGAGGDRVSVYPLAEQYLSRGYSVIAIDQRGSGANPDDRVTFGILESLDVEAAVSYARSSLGATSVIVHGQSMGAQTTAIYASNVAVGSSGCADAVICDSPVPGMEAILRLMFGDGPEGAYSPLTNYLIFTSKTYMSVAYGISFSSADTAAVVASDTLPTLVIVSSRDEVCLPDMVEDVYDNIGTDDKEIMYVDSAHVEGVIDDPSGYMSGVMSFLGEYGL